MAFSVLAAVSSQAATTIALGTTTQNFNSIGSGLPTDWTVRTGATATALGTTQTFTTTTSTWADTAGAFKNVAASTGQVSTATTTVQNNATDRALGLRQIGTFGDPGASFNFLFGTTGRQITALSIDLMMLSVQTRSTSFSIQYGIGTAPTSFTTLGTYTDPAAFGTTPFTFTTADFGTNLNNQSDVYFRVVALTASTGTGSRDTVAIDNFSITAVPEPSAALLGSLGAIALMRRRR